jgi:hypothetical protein
MKTITIVLMDLERGKGCAVITDSAPPRIGQPNTPAESLAIDLLRICKLQANSVQYGQASATLAGELAQTLAGSKAQ